MGKREIIGDTSKPITLDKLLELPIILLRQVPSALALMDDVNFLRKLEAQVKFQMNSVHDIADSLPEISLEPAKSG